MMTAAAFTWIDLESAMVWYFDRWYKKIIGWILPEKRILLQVGIVGIGVLGKTTISQKIFNSKQLVDRFVKRVWVSLSQIVSEEEIMKTMLKQLGQYVNGLDMAQTLPKIKRLLENKNCLAVMDMFAVLKAGETERVQVYQRGRDGVVA